MSSILPLINSPADLRGLTIEQLEQLAREIREFLISSVSKTGGHLASNLGVVELTLVLHIVYNTPYDKIVWDVGHQAYIHKILTGRKEKFHTLRQHKGISGFPKISESIHDCFNTGHSSTSISAALGMARARDLKNEKNSVIAVIGDGALTGGMAFEALNDAGNSPNNLIVILNDNEMSIDRNVGGLSSCLNRVRTEPIYFKVKKDIDILINKIPAIGKQVANTIKKAKGTLKYMMIPGMFFEELGFRYIGPVDGHDIVSLKKVLSKAKEMNGPILIHVLTQKGKGYTPAEESPHIFHGISSFDVETGEIIKGKNSEDYSSVFGEELTRIAEYNQKVVAITAAMPHGTGLSQFAQKYPERFFDVGIAEQHAVTLAAGLATEGLRPVFAVYSSFLQRAYDQIIHDVCLQNLPVVFAIDRAGIVGSDGETHQGIFDLSYLSHIPNMAIMAPKDYEELRQMLRFAVEHKGPIAIRYPRGQEKEVGVKKFQSIEMGRAELIQKGNDITIAACGRMVNTAVKVAKELVKFGMTADVINLRFVKPLDLKLILTSVEKTKNIVTIEDGMVIGGVGSMILQELNNNGITGVKVKNFGFPDKFVTHGNVGQLDSLYKLDYQSITCEILNVFQVGRKFVLIKS
ncbi:MAG: 1-deoxy-D-xylulose-5-phosphate synthase [Ignavibacteriales bacterium]